MYAESQRKVNKGDFGVAYNNAHGFCSKSLNDLPIYSFVRLSSPDYTLCSIRRPYLPQIIMNIPRSFYGILRDSLDGDSIRMTPQTPTSRGRCARTTRCEREQRTNDSERPSKNA
jgi:hypothetical protein